MTAWDVCVLGGGPAGATVAARLARLGHRVVVLERRPFPRQHVGESLSPAAWPVLDAAGIPRAAARATGVPVRTAGVRWRTDEEEQLLLGEGLTVDRGAFDTLLLDRARAAGAVVRAPLRADRPERVAGGWRVPTPDGAVHARFLADATGRRRLLGGRREATSPRTVAVHARWAGAWPADGPQTRIAAVADGWLWAAALPGGHVRTLAVTDPEVLAAEGGGSLLERFAGAAPGVGAPPEGAPVRVCDATSYRVRPPVEADAVRVGEAAFAIDPLSSSGVQTAVQSGLAAAATAATLLGGGNGAAALEYYGDLVRAAADVHARTASALYREHQRHAGERFWQRRAAPPAVATRSPGPALADLLPRRTRLVPSAALRPTACLVGDAVDHRPALHAPGLDRPVAFVGGHPVAPVLEQLRAAPTLAAAVAHWDRAWPGRGLQLAEWLHRHALLEVADPERATAPTAGCPPSPRGR
ncbi:flavin-dependent monooxygenase QhpG [Blastococcus deserti]|uniref:NAD(P)/FAD-dependent oxidoreductase n=1 Tax=Blastococcus deserti TaxID=2259033 RepID=A0ABW4X6K0_9ACTN